MSVSPGAVSLLGAEFNSLDGHFPVPVTPGGEAARRAVIELVDAGAYELESTTCLCGASHDRLICTVDRYRIPHRTVLCVECGLVRTDPRWTEKTYVDFYSKYYRTIYERPGHNARTIFAIQSANAADREHFITAARPVAAGSMVLEIGCGGGWNLLPFHRSGMHTVGYDFDEEYLSAGRDLGLDLRTGDIDCALRDGGQYDLVILSHVVEHFLQPVEELRKLRGLLKPGGHVYVEVPNLLAVDGQLLRYWQTAHTYSFVPQTLRALMGKAGFEEVALDRNIRSLWTLSDSTQREWPRNPVIAKRILRFLVSRERDTKLRLLARAVRGRLRRIGARL